LSTAIAIGIEYYAIYLGAKTFVQNDPRFPGQWVLKANVLTNGIMLFYVFVGYQQANGGW
jgi:hypothetical protein